MIASVYFHDGNNWKRMRYSSFWGLLIFHFFHEKNITFTCFHLQHFLSSVTNCKSGRYFLTSFSCKISSHLFCFLDGNIEFQCQLRIILGFFLLVTSWQFNNQILVQLILFPNGNNKMCK
jgi:hypothetical protein